MITRLDLRYAVLAILNGFFALFGGACTLAIPEQGAPWWQQMIIVVVTGLLSLGAFRYARKIGAKDNVLGKVLDE
jgi:membrane protein implicated in regulation of membrane protease activity